MMKERGSVVAGGLFKQVNQSNMNNYDLNFDDEDDEILREINLRKRRNQQSAE